MFAIPLTLALSPQTGRGDNSLSHNVGEGWGEGNLAVRKVAVTLLARSH
jgi:hypothetical protein